MKYLSLKDIDAYVRAFKLSNYVWNLVIGWDSFAKYTIGQQFVDAIDSISANIAEGLGRYSKKDRIRFYRISSGSLSESQDWNYKSVQRNLVTADQFNHILKELEALPLEINQLIKYTEKVLKH